MYLLKNDSDSPTRTNRDLGGNAQASAFYTSSQHFSNFYTGIREALFKMLSHIYPLLYTDYLFVFSRTYFGIFVSLCSLVSLTPFLVTPPHSLRLSVMSCLLGRLPYHAPLCHLQSVIRCAFGFHYELAWTVSPIHGKLCFLG